MAPATAFPKKHLPKKNLDEGSTPWKSRHSIPHVFRDASHRRIGILGGSFNPAHDGHAHIADMAVQQLHLDQVWWLVSPQNPLKSSQDMRSFASRYQSALKAAKTCHHAHKMRVTDLESRLGLRHTALTLRLIKSRMRHCHLVWIMGSDNLVHFHQWHNPKSIAKTMAIAVVNRPGAIAQALSSRGAKIAGLRLPPRRLVARQYPTQSWSFLRGALNNQSASAIRAPMI